jgi:hypothetical protein
MPVQMPLLRAMKPSICQMASQPATVSPAAASNESVTVTDVTNVTPAAVQSTGEQPMQTSLSTGTQI